MLLGMTPTGFESATLKVRETSNCDAGLIVTLIDCTIWPALKVSVPDVAR